MNIERVQYVAAAVRLSSLTEAAREMNVSPQAVSSAVAEMEKYYGRKLFDRVGRGLTPTPLGLQFAERAQDAASTWDDLMTL